MVGLFLILCSHFASSAFADGLVFSDDFEDGTTDKWSQDDYRNRCVVVTEAIDGMAGPKNGAKMLRCNWNGVVEWNDPACFETLVLGSWSYSSELLVRYWVRVDKDFDGTGGPKYYRIGAGLQSFGGLHAGGGQTFQCYSTGGQIGSTYWGDGSSTADGQWHKVEIYIKESTTDGIVRLWEDGTKLWEMENVNTKEVGGSWAKFWILSNWSGAPGCCDHDAANHMYWDDFQIFSDMGEGGTGLLSDASITTSSESPAVLESPKNLRVVE